MLVLLNEQSFRPQRNVEERVKQLLPHHVDVQIYERLGAFSANLSQQDISNLLASGAAAQIGQDQENNRIETFTKKRRRRKQKKKNQQSNIANTQASIYAVDGYGAGNDIVPWGTKLLLGDKASSDLIAKSSLKYVFILDTGISTTTGDLNVRAEWGYNFITPGGSSEDDNGHGTHLAGTIGALVNSVGIVGIAPGVNLIPFKVLDRQGMGSLSTIVAAIDRVLDTVATHQLNPRDVVVNLSFGTRGQDPILQAVISKATALGIRFTIAAGNSGRDVDGDNGADPFIPASYGQAQPGVYVASAITANLQMARFSNYDRMDNPGDIDNVSFAAPGENILSWYRQADGSFALSTLSGTSMAAAHLSGLLVLGEIGAGPMAIANGSNAADPLALLA